MSILRTDDNYLKTKDYLVSNEEFSLFWNAERDILITYPKPENLDKYYKSENYISHVKARKTGLQKTYSWVRTLNTARKLRWIEKITSKKTLRLLDIGAGTGYFVSMAQQRGWVAEGFEPNADARKVSFVPLRDTIDTKTKYDVVSLWHVLEHLPEIDEQLMRFKAMLNPGGFLIIAVPNYKSYDAKYYKKYWAGYDVPRHLWHFSKIGLMRELKKQKMDVVCVKPMFWDAFYVSLLSEGYKTKHFKRFILAFFIGAISNALAIFTKESSSNIFVAKNVEKSD